MIRSAEFDLNHIQPPLYATILQPDQIPTYIIGGPTLERWTQNGPPNRWTQTDKGPFPNLLESVGQRVSEAGLGGEAVMLFSDATHTDQGFSGRSETLSHLDLGDHPPRLFLLLPQFQAKVAAYIQEKTGLPTEVVRASLKGFGYGDHRVTLDRIMGALVVAAGKPIHFLTLDDDITVPANRVEWHPDTLPKGALYQPDSQLLAREAPDHQLVLTSGNSIVPLFKPLGQTVAQMKQKYPHMPAVEYVGETRAEAFRRFFLGEIAQFVVTYGDKPLANADKGVIIATTQNKGYRPDVHSYIVAQMALAWEFPDLEVPLESYRSGPTTVFAFQYSDSNFPDASAFGRRFDETTIYWPWMFSPNLNASKSNPLNIITGQARADIDMLGMLLNVISKESENPYLYLNVPVDTMHARSRLGANRQDIHEGTISATVGFIAEAEVLRRLVLDRNTGLWRVNRNELVDARTVSLTPIDTWRSQEEHTRAVFNKIARLGMMATAKGIELENRKSRISGLDQVQTLNAKIGKYRLIADSISGRLGGVNFESLLQYVDECNLKEVEYPLTSIDYSHLVPEFFENFWEHVSHEIRDHVLFYTDVVDAAPTIIAEVAKLINNGQYPVAEYRLAPPSNVVYRYTRRQQ